MVQLRSGIGKEFMSAINRIMLLNLEHQPPLLQKALGPLLETPGKMIRPWLLLNSYSACGGNPEQALHLATLIHDDLIDKASLTTLPGSDAKEELDKLALLISRFG